MTFFDWELVYTCNYRCSYCYYTSTGWETHHPLNVFPGLERLTEIWDRMHELYGSCHIQIAGGECSTYPRFYEFMRMMLSKHTLTVVTNLSFDVERFAGMVDVKRIFIGASFHPQFSGFQEFQRKVSLLKEKGVPNIFVNYVAYPDQLKDMGRYKQAFNEMGIEMYVDPYTGVYDKKSPYPAGYTDDEKATIAAAFEDGRADSVLGWARFNWGGSPNKSAQGRLLEKYGKERERRGEEPLPLEEVPDKYRATPWEKSTEPTQWVELPFGKFQRPQAEGDAGAESSGRAPAAPAARVADEAPASPPLGEAGNGACRGSSKKKPVLCRQGQRYAKIRANGDAFRCCAQLRDDRPSPLFEETVYLGNLFFDDDFRLLDAPKPCDYEPCPCDRCMVVGEEERWESRWKAPRA